MEKFIVKNFNGTAIYNFIWNDRLCWIGVDIAELLGYQDPSKGVAHCILAEKFEIGTEYDVLKKDELRKLKNLLIKEERFNKFLRVPKITILYEEGLYGLLQHSEKAIAIEFKKWLRREVVPSIRMYGNYESTYKDSKKQKSIVDDEENRQIHLLEDFKLAHQASNTFGELMDELGYEAKEKLEVFKFLYEKANIYIPLKLRD